MATGINLSPFFVYYDFNLIRILHQTNYDRFHSIALRDQALQQANHAA
jgi:hypothetical protein